MVEKRKEKRWEILSLNSRMDYLIEVSPGFGESDVRAGSVLTCTRGASPQLGKLRPGSGG